LPRQKRWATAASGSNEIGPIFDLAAEAIPKLAGLKTPGDLERSATGAPVG
jgi:hypothetical protein